MSELFERTDLTKAGGGGSFMAGLLTGAAIGAGIALLLAPKSGVELRGQIGARAGDLADAAQGAYRRATNRASDLTDRASALIDRGRDMGQQMYDKARDAASAFTDNPGPGGVSRG